MSFFENKVVIVTGASSGIGLASCRLFAQQGAKVVMAARSVDKLTEYGKEFSKYSEVLIVPTDVQKEEDCRHLIDATVERFGKIDILVNDRSEEHTSELQSPDHL